MDNDIATHMREREMMVCFRDIIAPPIPVTAAELDRGHPSPDGWANHPRSHAAHCQWPSSEEVTGTGQGSQLRGCHSLTLPSGSSDLTPISMNAATGNLGTFAVRPSLWQDIDPGPSRTRANVWRPECRWRGARRDLGTCAVNSQPWPVAMKS